jgi:hypothetical protein
MVKVEQEQTQTMELAHFPQMVSLVLVDKVQQMDTLTAQDKLVPQETMV